MGRCCTHWNVFCRLHARRPDTPGAPCMIHGAPGRRKLPRDSSFTMDIKSLLGVATPLARQLEDEMIAAVRLGGIPNLHDEMFVFDSARIVAEQIKIPDTLL